MAPSALLVIDDSITGELSEYMLRREGVEVAVAASGPDALELLSRRQFDLLVIHAVEFGAEWAEFVAAARARFQPAIIVVASSADHRDALAGYEAGADEFVALPSSPSVVLAKMRVWLRRARVPAPREAAGARIGALRLDADNRRLYGSCTPPVRLSILETRVLNLFAAHPGEILPSNVILQRVWGCSGKEDGALVKNTIYRLRRKIEAASDGDVRIESIPGSGYVVRIHGRDPVGLSS